MRLEEFKQRVYEEFGPDLHRATPQNVREFLEKLPLARPAHDGFHVLNEKHVTLESILRDFFAQALVLPQEEALILLWTVGIELAFGVVEDHLSLQLTPLFQGLDD